MERMARGAAIAALTLLAAIPAVVLAEAPRQSATDRYTTTKPGRSSGRRYSVEFTDPRSPSGKPPSLAHVHFTLPPGGRFDTAAIARCQASDAELIADGPSACPAASKVGVNTDTLDTGEAAERYLVEDVDFFNADRALIILTRDRATGVRDVVRGTVGTTTLDIDLPFLPGSPPDGAADKRERAVFYARSGPHGNYLTTPRRCPRSHVWTETVQYTYRDGVTETARLKTPCESAHHHRRRRR
jgi:hypothetical protein